MTSRLYHSLFRTSFTTGLPGDIVALGDSIRAHFGGIAESWPSKCEHNTLIPLSTCDDSSSNGQVVERVAGRCKENKDGTMLFLPPETAK